MFKLSQKSLNKLEGVHEDLAKVVKLAITLTAVDFMVIYGLRTVEEQKRLYAQGRTTPGNIVTWTMNSDHITGRAVDLGALKDGKYIPGNNPEELRLYDQIANAMLEAAAKLQIPLTHGIMKNGKLTDIGHFSLNKRFYERPQV